jgi:hypothetical protein
MKNLLKSGLIAAMLVVGLSAFAAGPQKGFISASAAEKVALAHYQHGKVMGAVKLTGPKAKGQYDVVVKSGTVTRDVMVGQRSGKIEKVTVRPGAKPKMKAAAHVAAKPKAK